MATSTQRAYEGQLPPEVLSCLNNARFLHLATCTSTLRPHIALMNYTYIPPTKTFTNTALPTAVSSTSGPGVIIMLLSPTTKKLQNITSNPQVSLLVHDWISQRPPTASGPSSPVTTSLSPLAQFLQNMNSSELQSYSHTVRGFARILNAGSDEEEYYRGVHKEANKFEGAKCYVEGEEGSVFVVVELEGGKIADWKGGVEDWGLPEEDDDAAAAVNGVRIA
ncbi:hypothetical protein TWF730_001480 [Orbilia blumenaviensis]|uniref:Pyridoxamine 5'-phosphate oxidase putative domain-containing protein n=1 Tax=Orbilia blumenaviensis TaxID=1796055 RepID=A0AAV9UHV3_9PEZI